MSLLAPIRTAQSPNTIWSHIAEDEFRKHLVALEECTNAVPIDPQISSLVDVEDRNLDSRCLPLSIEKQIADDFAFIAAVTEGAQSVAAVCIEQHIDTNNGSEMVIKVAGMDMVDQSVRTMLSNIVSVLMEMCHDLKTSESTNEEEATTQVFRIITSKHRQKLLGRLRSKKWSKPQHLSLSHKKPLWQDFDNLIHRVQHVYPKKSDRKARSAVEEHLKSLRTVYEAFETAPEGEELEQLQSLVQTTFTFCRNASMQSYAAKLQNLRLTSQIAAALKTLRQLEKIGAYRRIAETLIQTAIGYSDHFQRISLEYLTPYSSIPTTIAYESWARTCHVHAEVQIVVHYALLSQRTSQSIARQGQMKDGTQTPAINLPRVIGTSKFLCYLCYCFLRGYGHFQLLNTHGRLYDQWTVPDLEAYTPSTREKIAQVLKEMDDHVSEQISKIKEPNWRPEPMTSRQNLLCCD